MGAGVLIVVVIVIFFGGVVFALDWEGEPGWDSRSSAMSCHRSQFITPPSTQQPRYHLHLYIDNI